MLYFYIVGVQLNLFILFGILVGGFLVFDLGFLNRKAHEITTKSALIQSIFWVCLSLLFAFLIYIYIGSTVAVEFLSAYLTEKTLSIDNLFVIMLIFNYFKVEKIYHHKVLFWGILGAIVFRAIFILIGAYLIQNFHWILYIFGVILIISGARLLFEKREEHADFEKNKVIILARKFLPISDAHHQGKFFSNSTGKFAFTTLFLIVLIIEVTDVIFAIDSIPAAFAISQNPFVVFTSNIFAIMGLRALYFFIQGILHKFHHIQKGLAFILFFVGLKLLLDIVDIKLSSAFSFAVILGVISISIITSLLFPKKEKDFLVP